MVEASRATLADVGIYHVRSVGVWGVYVKRLFKAYSTLRGAKRAVEMV